MNIIIHFFKTILGVFMVSHRSDRTQKISLEIWTKPSNKNHFIYFISSLFNINLIEIHACIKKLLHKKNALKYTVKHKFSSMAISSWDKEVLDNFFKSIASNSSHILFGKPFSFWGKSYISISCHFLWCGSNRGVSIYYIDLPKVSVNHICHKNYFWSSGTKTSRPSTFVCGSDDFLT